MTMVYLVPRKFLGLLPLQQKPPDLPDKDADQVVWFQKGLQSEPRSPGAISG